MSGKQLRTSTAHKGEETMKTKNDGVKMKLDGKAVDDLHAVIRAWLAQIGQRGGRGGVGAAKRRTSEQCRAAGLASAARRAAKRKAADLAQQGQAGGAVIDALGWVAVVTLGTVVTVATWGWIITFGGLSGWPWR